MTINLGVLYCEIDGRALTRRCSLSKNKSTDGVALGSHAVSTRRYSIMDKREFNLGNSIEDSVVEDIMVEEVLTDDGVGHAYLDCNEFNEDGNSNGYSSDGWNIDGWYMDGWGDSSSRYQDNDDFYRFVFKIGLVLGSLGTMIALGLWKLITKNKGKKGGRSRGK